MSGPVEREIKLRYESAEQARAAIGALGATLRTARRLQSDVIFDTVSAELRTARSALRVRLEASRAFLTFKGPPQPGVMKVREEIETAVDDGPAVLRMLDRLGYRVAFVYEKDPEEYEVTDALVTIDETPVGVFVEIEGTESAITTTAGRLGRGQSDYMADSYRTLYVRDCLERGQEPGDRMVFLR